MYDRSPKDVPKTSHHLVLGRPATASRRRPVNVPIRNFCIFVFPVKNNNRCVKQQPLHLKSTFLIKLSFFFCWSSKSPLKVRWRYRTLGPLEDLQGTFLGRRVPAGLISSLSFTELFLVFNWAKEIGNPLAFDLVLKFLRLLLIVYHLVHKKKILMNY